MSTNPYNDDKRLLELLERWQSGDFSRADERELHALADSDDFRREAVEGFWSLPEADHAAHLIALRSRLGKRTGVAKRVALPQILAAIAAVGLLVLTVVWLIPNKKETASMAQQEAAKPVEEQPIASNLPDYETNADKTGTDNAAKQDQTRSAAQSRQSSPAIDVSPAASAASSEVASAPPPVINRGGEVAEKKIAAKPDDKEAEYSSVKNEQDDVDLAPGNAAPRKEDFKETPPTKSKDSMKKKAALPSADSQPTGGWAVFENYLRLSARLPEAARQNNVSGSVRLKFRLDENNQPVDFQKLRSLGYGCDEEAIRLIKAFSWQRGNDPEIIVDVPFVR